MESDRQPLHAASSLPLVDDLAALAPGTNEKPFQGLHRNEHAAIANVRSGGTERLGNPENLVQ